MSATYTIGLDLGGTNVKGGVCDEQHRILARREIDTQAERGQAHVLARMAGLITDLLREAALAPAQIRAVGIGAPGPLSHSEGIIIDAPNLPGWRNVPLRDLLSQAAHLPVVLDNDANAAAFGEAVAGAGQHVDSLVLLTLGTGIGGGIILNRQLWRGCDDSAGEIGHTVLVPGGRPCPCGQRGCCERYASANAVAQRLVEAVQAGEPSRLAAAVAEGRDLDSRDVLTAARDGDGLARRIWDETCRYLALACINVEHLLSPELILLTGGLTQAGARLLDPVREYARTLRWHIASRPPEIGFAALGVDAGIIGAAALARL